MSSVKTHTLAILASALAAGSAAVAHAVGHPTPGVSPGTVSRYATDAYPGFDNEKEIVSPERKEPKWFAFINGPNRDNARDQLAYCGELLAAGDYSKARKHLDALVREWPTSPEAPKAQLQLAETLLNKLLLYEDAFAEYRYLLDFYSLQCDYNAVADKLYQVAGIMKLEGKEVMFIRFANTVDVRRAFEACVLHAPGAKWVPEALLTIAGLREDEGKYEEAVKVYENLRNIHPDAPEAKTAMLREADSRMICLRECSYNRARCRETMDFLRLAVRGCRPEDAQHIQDLLAEATSVMEEEAYRGAAFYDSPTRTLRSAVSAYERFLAEYPGSARAADVKARLEELKAMQAERAGGGGAANAAAEKADDGREETGK